MIPRAQFLFRGSDGRNGRLAEDFASPEKTFNLEEGRSAEMMIESMTYPVLRAVFVPATEAGSKTGVVCATSETGELEIFTFGGEHKPTSLNKRDMNAELEVAAATFCGVAFTKIAGD